MDDYRFYMSCAGFSINDGWFLIVGSVFKTNPKSIIVIATKENDACSVDKIEQLDQSSYKIYVKDIIREDINQKINIQMHIIYTCGEGMLFRQTLKYNGKSELSLPEKIFINH